MERWRLGRRLVVVGVMVLMAIGTVVGEDHQGTIRPRRNAYAGMMYMGTPRDYEFYVALRVMLRSLAKLKVDADIVVIASPDVPSRWIRAMEQEDGAKVIVKKNMENPYKESHKSRFKLTLNKLYAWSLVDYDRVVMLDSDNLLLQKTDELFQCGQFCAVFINPCIFHTGLFVLEPSMEVFNNMVRQLRSNKPNNDGADQGFLGGYFSDLLDSPMFHPSPNNTRLLGNYRLPLGYQMDASYYYLKLLWRIPCGPNSVITFPSALWLKPWYWWSWPVLPLGYLWHEQRRSTLGYGAEVPLVLMQSATYLVILMLTRMARPSLNRIFHRRSDKNLASYYTTLLKLAVIWSLLVAYTVPFFLVPKTVHPLLGWPLYLLGSSALSSLVINTFLVPLVPVFMPWFGVVGALAVLVFPWYSDGVVRCLALFGYSFCCAPFLWISLQRVLHCLQTSIEKDALVTRLGDQSLHQPLCSKLY